MEICTSRKKSCFASCMHSHANRERPAVQLLSVQYDASPRPEWKYRKGKTPSFTSHTFAKKDGMLNLCTPFVLAIHPPQIEQECLNHYRSVGSLISCIALVDLCGVISWRLSKDVRDAFKFRIPNFHSWGPVRIQRKKRRASKCWHAYSSCLATRRLRNQTVITRIKKKPSKFT